MASDGRVYKTVGAVDRGVAETLQPTGETILVDTGEDEYLVAQPKGGSSDE
jgi:hypothetical protein